MLKKAVFLAIFLALVFGLSGCDWFTEKGNNDSVPPENGTNTTSQTGYVTDRTDYTIFYQGSMPAAVPGGVETTEYIIGHPIPEAETIKYNAYFVPWRIDFSQVLRSSQILIGSGCNTLQEQVIYVEGWIDLDLTDMEVGPNDLPNPGPAKPKGTVHEKVTGTAGSWICGSDLMTKSANVGSVQYVQSVSGEHTANFSDASNLTSLTVSGADIYLDLSMPEDIMFIWPAGTKIEYAPEGTPIPLEPLSPNQL